jgi:chromosomal replication initiator protein
MSDKPRQSIIDFPSSPEFNFTNFVIYKNSEIAYFSAKDICADGDLDYSTLYISGASGLGKTHLLMAIGNSLAENFPDKKALYLRSEDFIRNVAEEEADATNKTLDQLSDVDFLLMDNMDEIAGDELAQEKLYHIYNTLTERGSKIIFAGRKTPVQETETEDYLKSRFQWGMTAEIHEMDDAASSQVIKKLCKDINLSFPPMVITFMLTRISRDFDSIKNAVTKINEESLTRKSKVTIPLVKETLGL